MLSFGSNDGWVSVITAFYITNNMLLQVYQVNAHSIRVLSDSPFEAEKRKKASAPCNAEASGSASRQTEASTAMATFTLGKRCRDN